MVSCAACVGKRVFEVASRQMISVCVHCFKESSRIRHPPANNKRVTGPPWWRKDKDIESLISKVCSSTLPSNERNIDSERSLSKDIEMERSVNLSSSLIPGLFDEADEILNLGFRKELEYILSQTPKEKRTLLFSATISKGIEKLASKYQNNALRISTIKNNKQHLDIKYHAIKTSSRNIEYAIMNILRYHESKKSLVFCGTRANVNHLTSRLNNRGFLVVSISGELSQKERLNALRSIKNGHSKVCVATDVAARGIDLPNLDLVIHADLPKTKESLVHRSGRTGRAAPPPRLSTSRSYRSGRPPQGSSPSRLPRTRPCRP